MKIESIIRRDGGTVVTLGCMVYQFLPDESGRHVAEVSDPDHIGKLLAIREGYRLAADETPTKIPEKVNDPVIPDALVPVGDDGDANANGDGDTDPEPRTDGENDAGDEGEPAELDREALAVEFEKKFGNRPHGRWSAERIRDELKSA